MKLFRQALPYLVLLIAVLFVAMQYMRNAQTSGGQVGIDYDAAAQTVVMDDGRAKPLDSVARNALLMLYEKQRFTHEGEKVEAIVWMMDVIARPQVAHNYQVFRVDHADLIELMGLRPADGHDDKFFSYNQVQRARPMLMERVGTIGPDGPENVYDRAVVDLWNKIQLYEAYATSRRPLVISPDPGVSDSAWSTLTPSDLVHVNPFLTQELGRMHTVIATVQRDRVPPDKIIEFFDEKIEQGHAPPLIAEYAQEYELILTDEEAWQAYMASEARQAPDQAVYFQNMEYIRWCIDELTKDPSTWNLYRLTGSVAADTNSDAGYWLALMQAYRDQEPTAFSEVLEKRDAYLAGLEIPEVQKAGFEVFFNRAMPFLLGIELNVFGFLLAMGALYFGRSERGSWGRSVWLGMMSVLSFGLLIHTLGIFARMYIHGRPPVTDLYSSAVLVGWAGVAVCLLIEWLTKRGIGGVVASVIGFATLIIAHNLHLQSGGDTIAPMRAVLDSNFWLATHVIIVTLGYAATFVAGLLAIVYIVMGMATPKLDRTAARQITSMVYGTVCFALLLSFVGTVLGGIWADQSWGRFWGWDPKENGAVMIVIMNAIILHAKWGRLVKERGLMVLAVGGNIITAWSWFGTNELGVGLHAYGFTEGTLYWLRNFVVSQLLIMGVALLVPTHLWWSFRKPKAVSKSDTARKPARTTGGKGKRPAPAGG